MDQKLERQKNALMYGHSKAGFTFVEILLVIMLISMVASIVIPNLNVLLPDYKKKEFVSSVSALINLTWQNALTTGKTHRVYFDLKQGRIVAQIELPTTEKADESSYAAVVNDYYATSLTWPATYTLKQFYVDGKDQLKLITGKAEEIWFYIVPDGRAQATIMNISIQQDTGTDQELSMVVNPYTVQLKQYDMFQKP